jgi:D-lactate dehydrogenase (cytochrome)
MISATRLRAPAARVLRNSRVHPRVRLASTSTPAPASAGGPRLALLGGAVLGSALAGYALGTRNGGAAPAALADAHRAPPPTDSEPQYGSPDDFRAAIAELRAAFTDADAVADDEDTLYQYGFSENDYHPGACSRSR